MQQPLRSLTQRFTQIFLIQSLDVRILMRFTQRLLCIFPIQCIGTCIQHLRVAMMQRLSASTDTATRTCHNLNHMILIPSMANIFPTIDAHYPDHEQYPPSVQNHPDHRRTAHTGQTTHLLKVYILQCPPGINLINRTQCRFHHTTGRSEDDTGIPLEAPSIIKFLYPSVA